MKLYFKILNILVVGIFSCCIFFPEVNSRAHLLADEKGNENRAKAQKPIFDLSKLDAYVREFNSYYSDNFNLRDNLIKFHNLFEYYIFNVSPAPNEVVVGKDGWFYSKNCVTNFKGANLFTRKELEEYRQEIIKRSQWSCKNGIKYYLVIVPSKMSIYPEHLPDHIVKVSEITRYDQVISLNNNADVNIIDVKENILNHKNDGYDLYQRTDDHWNDIGAYYGYEAIMRRLSVDFPGLSPIPIDDFKIATEEHSGNMTKMLNLEKSHPEIFLKLESKNKIYGYQGKKRNYPIPYGIADWDYEIVRKNDSGKKLKCLVIRDSFSMLLVKYFQEHFRKTIFIHNQWKGQIDENIILNEKPDIIINIMVETFIGSIIENPFIGKEEKIINDKFQLKTANSTFVCIGPADILYADKDKDDRSSEYAIVDLGNNKCALLSYDNYYLSAELGQMNEITTNRDKIADWETFTMIKLDGNHIALQAANGKYVTVDEKSLQLFARADAIGKNEKFEMVKR